MLEPARPPESLAGSIAPALIPTRTVSSQLGAPTPTNSKSRHAIANTGPSLPTTLFPGVYVAGACSRIQQRKPHVPVARINLPQPAIFTKCRARTVIAASSGSAQPAPTSISDAVVFTAGPTGVDRESVSAKSAPRKPESVAENLGG